MGREQVRDFLMYLVKKRMLAPATVVIYAAAIRFLYEVHRHTRASSRGAFWAGPALRAIGIKAYHAGNRLTARWMST
jgi:hypothetical protein